MAAALRNYKAYATSLDQLKLRAVSAAVWLGLGTVLRDRIRVESTLGPTDDAIDAYLASVFGQDLFVSLYIGPRRAVRKPVLQLLSPRGDTFAFVKIGIDEFTRDLVRSEAKSLRLLSARPFTRLVVPRLMHHGEWNGHEVLAQEALSRIGSGKFNSSLLSKAMNELARSQGVQSLALIASPYASALRSRLQALPDSGLTALLRARVKDMERIHGDKVLEFGSWHGDWAPWNMTTSNEEVLVWDWEQFSSDVPIGLDAVHFDVQRAVVMAAASPQDAFTATRSRANELLYPFGLDGDAARFVVDLYVIEIAVRYLEDGETEAGNTPMSRLSSWLPTILHDQSNRAGR